MSEKWEGYLLQTVEVAKRAMLGVLAVDAVTVSMMFVWHIEGYKVIETLMVVGGADLS